MNLFPLLIQNFCLVIGLMFVLWLVSLPIRNASIVDVFWGSGFVLVAWSTYFAGESSGSRSLLMAILTTAWGVRLSGYLTWRNWGTGEDHRYAEMREKIGKRFGLLSLFVVFWLQGLIMWGVSLPIQVAPFGERPLGWLDAVGASVFGVGLLFESVGDWQLARFKANPDNRGQVMDRGLWRYTRHPNYFGDFLVWWGVYLIAIGGGAWWTIVSPLVMSLLLMRVSGVTLLERSLKRKRPDYEAYAARTNAFFPRPPRSLPTQSHESVRM